MARPAERLRSLAAMSAHKSRRAWRRLAGRALAIWFGAASRTRRRTLVEPGAGCAVSLTTHGRRLASVHLAIESIGRGTRRPSRLILWIDAGDAARTTWALRRQAARGLEIRETRAEWGPHKKYFPYCRRYADDGLLLVTADDDVFYQRSWLEGLQQRAEAAPDVVWCHRARSMAFAGGGLLPYLDWPLVNTSRPSLHHLATGVGGVTYPPALQRVLKEAGTGFAALHGRTDDIWLHLLEVRHAYPIGQVSETAVSNIEVPRSQSVGLLNANQAGGGNDAVLSATYTSEELALLAGCTVPPQKQPSAPEGPRVTG